MEQFKWLPMVYEELGPAQISVLKPEATDLIAQFGTIAIIVRGQYRRRGYGTAAMERALAIAKSLGHTEVYFVITRAHTASRKLVQRTGAKLIVDEFQQKYVLRLVQESELN